MGTCLQDAMTIADFGLTSSGCCNLFMVNEAEAAAMYALASDFHNLEVSKGHDIIF